MKTKGVSYKLLRIMFALIAGVFVSVFSAGAYSVHAAEAVEEVVVSEGDVQADSEDSASSVMFLLMGGMLIIMIAVIIAVVSSVSSVAAIESEV